MLLFSNAGHFFFNVKVLAQNMSTNQFFQQRLMADGVISKQIQIALDFLRFQWALNQVV